MKIDRKFTILANSIGTGKGHSENDAVLFLAKDKALPATLQDYRRNCEKLGADQAHLKGVDLLIERVTKYQQEHGSKIPDTDPVKERFALEE